MWNVGLAKEVKGRRQDAWRGGGAGPVKMGKSKKKKQRVGQKTVFGGFGGSGGCGLGGGWVGVVLGPKP